jgi:hypothetical protein
VRPTAHIKELSLTFSRPARARGCEVHFVAGVAGMLAPQSKST